MELADVVLRDGGSLVVKVLEGGETASLLKSLRLRYQTVKVLRPQSTRVGSIETYVVALDKRPMAQGAAAGDDDDGGSAPGAPSEDEEEPT